MCFLSILGYRHCHRILPLCSSERSRWLFWWWWGGRINITYIRPTIVIHHLDIHIISGKHSFSWIKSDSTQLMKRNMCHIQLIRLDYFTGWILHVMYWNHLIGWFIAERIRIVDIRYVKVIVDNFPANGTDQKLYGSDLCLLSTYLNIIMQ